MGFEVIHALSSELSACFFRRCVSVDHRNHLYSHVSRVVSACTSILKLNALAARSINQATAVRTLLLLVLFLCESLALGDDQIGVRAVSVVVRDVGVAGKLGVDFDVCLNALEAVFDVVLLRLGFLCCGRSVKLALVAGWCG